MKTIYLFCVVLLCSNGKLFAQVSWQYNIVQTSANKYKLSITATIEEGWHLYAQKQPASAIAEPTTIKFTINPLVSLANETKEEGKLEHVTYKELGISANQYAGKVVFTKEITLKKPVHTNISGKITYQVCNEERCLPTTTTTFSVPIGN